MISSDDYERKYYEASDDESKAEELLKSKIDLCNGTIYKYCPIFEGDDARQYHIENLNNSNIYLSSIENFNDPFDSFFTLTLEHIAEVMIDSVVEIQNTTKAQSKAVKYVLLQLIKNEDVSKRIVYNLLNKGTICNKSYGEMLSTVNKFIDNLSEMKEKIYEGIKQTHKKLNSLAKISCFCDSYENELMWAHYANKHKGFCVQYNLKKSKDNSFLMNLHPVFYSKTRPDFPLEFFDFSYLEPKLTTNNKALSKLLIVLLTKSELWEYEHEWRYIDLSGSSDLLINVNCIDKIILGCNIEEAYEQKLIKIGKEKGIEITKMFLDPIKYQFNESIISEK